MAEIANELNNLIGGVSQQPDAVRLPNTCEEMVNAWPSPVHGLTKRMPSILVGQPESVPAGLTKYHVIHRDAAEQYVVAAGNSGIDIWNAKTGAVCTVSDPDTLGVGYVGITSPDQIKFLTVGDNTFVLNTARTPSLTSAETPDLPEDGMVFLRQGNYLTNYYIRIDYKDTSSIDRFSELEIITWDGVNLTPGFTYVHNSDDIMAAFETYFDGDIGSGGSGEFTITRVGSTLHFSANSTETITSIKVTDGAGDSVLESVLREAPRVSGWLPDTAADGFTVEIVGDAEVDGDNYWVAFSTDDPSGFGEGVWQETTGPGIKYEIEPDFMPHVLVNTATDTFEWRQPDWADRRVGDDDSNPAPSFIGTPIDGMFFYKNRLGFLSGENVVMSETGEYYNFWRITTLSLRDTARIDIASSHTRVSHFRNAVTFGNDLLLSTDRSQFVLRGEEILSPRTVQMPPASEYEVSPNVPPVSSGRTVFFPFAKGNWGGIRELYPVGDGLRYEASDLTVAVPKFIPSTIKHLTGSTLESCLFVLSDGALYPYAYLWGNEGKLLSSWGSWDFSADEVLHAECVDDELVVVLDRDGELTIERVSLSINQSEDALDHAVYLDSRITHADVSSLTYNAGSDTTTFTLPYDSDGASIQVVDFGGTRHTVAFVSGADVTVEGDITALDFYVGRAYTMRYTFSKPLVRYRDQQGFASRHRDPQHIARGRIMYADSSEFDVSVAVGGRSARNLGFDAVTPGSPAPVRDGEYVFGVMGRAHDTVVTITNSSPFPSNLTGVTWDTLYQPRPGKFRG